MGKKGRSRVNKAKKRKTSTSESKENILEPTTTFNLNPGTKCIHTKLNTREDDDKSSSPKKQCSSSINTLTTGTYIDQSQSIPSENSEVPSPIPNKGQEWPPVRHNTRLYNIRPKDPGDPIMNKTGWLAIPRPSGCDPVQEAFDIADCVDPYVQPQRLIPFPNFSIGPREFDGVCDILPESVSFGIQHWIRQWSSAYCASYEEIEAKMTAEQKQAVIDYLGDWCLFDDWDSMVAAFPPMEARFKDDVFRVFTEAVILKDIFQSVVENPFYYMDTDTHWDGRSAVLPPPHGQELFKHWQNTLRVNEIGAEKWRVSTVQMMNRWLEPIHSSSGEQGVISPVEAEDCNTGIRSWNIRQRYINQLVTNMLSKSSLIAPMRLETDPEKERDTKYVNYRDGQLRRCYGKAADLALQMWVMDDVTFRFDDQVKGVEPFKEQEDAGNRPREEKKWWYSAYNRDWEAHQRDGRIPVLLLWPNIWRVTWYERRKGNGPYEKPFAERHEPGYFEGDEYIYLDERGWVHLSFCSGTVYLGAMGLEKPEDSSSSCTTRRLNDEP